MFAAEKNKRPVAQERVDGAPHWVRDGVRGASTYRGFISSHKDVRLTLIAHGDFAEAVELFTRQLRSEGVQPYFTGLFSTSDNEASPQSRNFNFGRYVHYSRPLVRMSRNSHAQHYYAGDFPPGISSTGQQQLSIGDRGASYSQTANEVTAVRSGLGALSSDAARTMMRHRIAPRVLALHDYDALELENLYEELLMRARERGVPVGGLGVPYRGLSVPRKPVSQPEEVTERITPLPDRKASVEEEDKGEMVYYDVTIELFGLIISNLVGNSTGQRRLSSPLYRIWHRDT